MIACAGSQRALRVEESRAVIDFRKAIESGPIYSTLANAAGPATHTVREETGGLVVLRYRFRDGSELSATVDPRIESVEQEARWAKPFAGEPLELLRRAERVGYAPGGCGIDWQKPESESREGGTEQVFWGDVCNCQAHIRRDANGRVIALIMRSAC
jgi:hypothetical protein